MPIEFHAPQEMQEIMHSMFRVTTRGAAVLVALLVLGSGILALSSGTAHAQPLSTAAAHSSIVTVDGVGTAPGCAAGDSYCAYCMNYAAAAMCSQVQPATMMGQTLSVGKIAEGEGPVVGVDAAMPVLMSPTSASGGMALPTLSAIITGVMSPVGVSWQWCTAVGGGVWMPMGATSANTLC